MAKIIINIKHPKGMEKRARELDWDRVTYELRKYLRTICDHSSSVTFIPGEG